MVGRGHRGPEPLTGQRELFGRLIAAGVSNSEACRTVGVNRKTGTGGFGRSIPTRAGGVLHYPPVLSTRLVTVSPRSVTGH
jgi:transposase, IS30 family